MAEMSQGNYAVKYGKLYPVDGACSMFRKKEIHIICVTGDASENKVLVEE
jgi:hypothetical protein